MSVSLKLPLSGRDAPRRSKDFTSRSSDTSSEYKKGGSSKSARKNRGDTTRDEDLDIVDEAGENSQSQPSVRNILGFMERFDRIEIQELLSQLNCHWLLSLDDFKIPIEHPHGMITQMTPINEDHLILLLPHDSTVPDLDYREVHQILRELTIGMYVLNQHPCLQLEANFDESTTCQMPPAYVDTKVGQIMIMTDYWLKALWHGKYLLIFFSLFYLSFSGLEFDKIRF
jgi:hypothetical protein